MPTDFLALPTELRLQVYCEVVTTSMADGKIADMSGLLFSCGKIYSEMTAECISKVRPILDSMKAWTHYQPDDEPPLPVDVPPLRVQLPLKYNFVNAPTEAEISIPIPCTNPLRDDEDDDDYTFRLMTQADDAVGGPATQLNALLNHHWSRLTFCTHFHGGYEGREDTVMHHQHQLSAFESFFLHALFKLGIAKPDEWAVLTDTDTLVIRVGVHQDVITTPLASLIEDMARNVLADIRIVKDMPEYDKLPKSITCRVLDGVEVWEIAMTRDEMASAVPGA